MTVNEAIKKVVIALKEVSGSKGSPNDEEYVDKVLNESADNDDYYYVGGIPLRNFYAYSAVAFDNSHFWDQIQDTFGTKIAKPNNLDADIRIVQVAAYIA